MLKITKFINYFEEILELKKINNILFINLNFNFNKFISKNTFKLIKNFFTYSFLIYFLRIVWRGKAYRIRFFKKSSKFTLNFGHSHWYKFIFNKSFFNFFRIRRQNYLVFFYERKDVLTLKKTINSVRSYNKYTRRGVRFKRSIFIKRFGKISQVNSILHSF